MKLIIGLGNPGFRYKKTRHNVGWLALEYIRNYEPGSMNYGFKRWKKSKNIQAEISEGNINNEKILLAKPLTFMNNSGVAVKSLVTSYQLDVSSDVIIIHDDIDIPFGEHKIQSGRGAAGHNGVQSIIDTLGTNKFQRIRIGIKPIELEQFNTEKFVLKKFFKAELGELVKTIFPKIKQELT